ncbi:MAG: anthranilate synthase component I family protein [Candidatus Magnetomorum sp.]|nr:anthranilate synthase component I family protein [Candidatus Magnetomorum sp.]
MKLPLIQNVQTTNEKKTWDQMMDCINHYATDHSFSCLLSGTKLDCATHVFFGMDPFLIVRVKNGCISLETSNQTASFKGDIFQYLKELFAHYQYLDLKHAGAIGFFSYECGHYIERLPHCTDNEQMDDSVICFYSIFYSYTIAENVLTRYDFQTDVIPFHYDHTRKIIQKESSVTAVHQHVSKKDYVHKLKKVIEYIREGDIYQANISQKFTITGNFDGFAIFKRLFAINPAPFFAYLNVAGIEIISSSPERFIVCDGPKIETRPIKGTISRGKTPDKDAINRQWLFESAKDQAELSMIVDLLRNDIGKCARSGTVNVREFKRVEPYNNVYHLIAIVDALLEDAVLPMDVIKATFPGGSITGCPKIRSMEIISEMEQETRGIYTGAIFFHSFGHYFDSNIAIRTLLLKNNQLTFRVGGGIVYDSIPENEYDETIYKGQSILQSLGIDYKKYLSD